MSEVRRLTRLIEHAFTASPAGDLVWDIAIEHTHHGAEIGLLRDLIRGKAREDWYPGPWD